MDNKLNTMEQEKLLLVAKKLTSTILQAPESASRIILEYKAFTESICRNQGRLPDSIKRIVYEHVLDKFSHHKEHVELVTNEFSSFFDIIRNRETTFALQCIDTLNTMQAKEASLVLRISRDQLSSWVIIKLLISAGKETPVPCNLRKSNFLKKVVSEQKYRDCFDKKLCNELDSAFFLSTMADSFSNVHELRSLVSLIAILSALS